MQRLRAPTRTRRQPAGAFAVKMHSKKTAAQITSQSARQTRWCFVPRASGASVCPENCAKLVVDIVRVLFIFPAALFGSKRCSKVSSESVGNGVLKRLDANGENTSSHVGLGREIEPPQTSRCSDM